MVSVDNSVTSISRIGKMQWAEVLENPALRDLPFKIETNRFGQIVMSPASRKHGRYQAIISNLLFSMASHGEVSTEVPIETREGVKVPDVVWVSAQRLAAETNPLTFTKAPELCVEVLSPSNRDAEILEKRGLYFEQGAVEVWICDEAGKMTFETVDGEIDCSSLFPTFPKQI
jgi:Uma2 family endonuclease